MAVSKKAKQKASKRKTKTADMQQIAECVSNLRELHKLQGVLLEKLDCRVGLGVVMLRRRK